MVNTADLSRNPGMAARVTERTRGRECEALVASLIGPHPRAFHETEAVRDVRPQTAALDRYPGTGSDAVGPSLSLRELRPAAAAQAVLDDTDGSQNGRFADVAVPGAAVRSSPREVSYTEPRDRRPEGGELTAGDLEAVQSGLQALSAAMVLLDAAGRLVFANREAWALLAAADGISLDRSDVVRCIDSAAQKHLCRMIRPCDTGRRPPRPRHGRRAKTATFTIRRDFGRPLVALMISQSAGTPGAAAHHHRTVLLLRDPERELRVATELLPALFGLSAAEAAVAARLAAGASLEQIAEERDVQLITVRNQLKSALGKFGVRRQAELVSIVLRTIQF